MLASKRPRKKPRKPQQISEATWLAIEKAVVAGMGYSEAARVFGIHCPHAIIMRSRRDKWPVPSRVEERARQLQDSLQRRSEAAEQRRDGNEITTETLAQSWAERGEQHRAVAVSWLTIHSKPLPRQVCQSRAGATLTSPTRPPGAMQGSMIPRPARFQSG
jgi:hypothetical protein